jgi:peptidoglycan/xylan/chitin deacetylase (PgdA/CDA1 family)
MPALVPNLRARCASDVSRQRPITPLTLPPLPLPAMRERVLRALSCLAILACVASMPASPYGVAAPAAMAGARAQRDDAARAAGVSILVYHRFGPVVADSMTVRTSTFREQLQYLKDHGYRTVPLRSLIAYLRRLGPPPPPRSVVITADDGHRSVMTDMLPLVREFNVPVTLFIYPAAISNASYALSWDQIRALSRTGLFDVQSHTYWHPNFKVEKRRLGPDAYRGFVLSQMARSRTVLASKLGVDIDVLAWPFGIYDEDLLRLAAQSGYVAALTLDGRVTTASDPIMALPRFLVTDAASGKRFAAMLPRQLP